MPESESAPAPTPSDPNGTQSQIGSSIRDGLEIENRVTFFPPLHDSRRGWVLGALRREKVTSVWFFSPPNFLITDHTYLLTKIGLFIIYVYRF